MQFTISPSSTQPTSVFKLEGSWEVTILFIWCAPDALLRRRDALTASGVAISSYGAKVRVDPSSLGLKPVGLHASTGSVHVREWGCWQSTPSQKSLLACRHLHDLPLMNLRQAHMSNRLHRKQQRCPQDNWSGSMIAVMLIARLPCCKQFSRAQP